MATLTMQTLRFNKEHANTFKFSMNSGLKNDKAYLSRFLSKLMKACSLVSKIELQQMMKMECHN